MLAKSMVGAALAGALLVVMTPARAEDSQPREDIGARADRSRSSDAAAQDEARGPAAGEVERLKRLRERDPERFRREVQERKQRLRERMEHLKTTDPEAYDHLMNKWQERREQHLEELRQRDPEKFRAIMAERQTKIGQRLQELKEKDPQRFEQLMQRRQDRLEQMKAGSSEMGERWKARRQDGSSGSSGGGRGEIDRAGGSTVLPNAPADARTDKLDGRAREHVLGERPSQERAGEPRNPRARPGMRRRGPGGSGRDGQ